VPNVLVVGLGPWRDRLIQALVDRRDRIFVVSPACAAPAWPVAALASERVMRLAVDVLDVVRLARWLRHVQLLHGGIDVVLVEVAGPGLPSGVWRVIGEEIAGYRRMAWDLYVLVGCAERHRVRQRPAELPDACRYHVVVLGEGRGQRALTGDEVVAGLLFAWQTDQPVYTIGQCEAVAG
jgi:hypothetical protein